jgi:hypothetical protein
MSVTSSSRASSSSSAVASAPTTRRGALVLVAGAVIAVAANTVIALSALAAGASGAFAPLGFAVFAPFTVVAFAAAYLGWRIVRRRSSRPARVLRVLVPVLGILSFIPDAVLLATGFIPHASVTAVIALALMHVVVVSTVVPVASRVAPVR